MPDGDCADPSLPLHLDQGRGSSKKESFSLRVSPALHPPERPSPRRADMAGHGHGSGDAGTEENGDIKKWNSVLNFLALYQSTPRPSEHPPVMGENMSKRLGGIKGCK